MTPEAVDHRRTWTRARRPRVPRRQHSGRLRAPSHLAVTIAIAALTIAACLATTRSASAATQQTAEVAGRDASVLTGTVKDATGLPISGTVVVLRYEATGLERLARTGASGAFTFEDVHAGVYQLVATRSGFAPITNTVRVPSAEPLRLVLELAPYEEAVTVVSAARQDRLRDATTSPVTVLNGDAMRDAGYESVGEALREVAGVVTRRGSEGSGVAGEQIQGIDSRQVLVLIDGQPVVGARGVKSGIVNLDRESTLRLDRVEVVKGAASALYGSDAIGGVINMITREPRHPLELGGQASAGSHGMVDAAANAGGLGRLGSVFVSGGRHQQDAFDLTPTTPDTTGAAFTRHDVTAHVSASPAPDWLLAGTVTSYWNTQTGRSVGELGPEEDRVPSDSQTFGGRAEWRLTPKTTAELRAYRGRYSETADGALLDAARTPLAPGDLFQGLSKIDGSLAQTIGQRQQRARRHRVDPRFVPRQQPHPRRRRQHRDDARRVGTVQTESGKRGDTDHRRPRRRSFGVRNRRLAEDRGRDPVDRPRPCARVVRPGLPRARSRSAVLPLPQSHQPLSGDRQSTASTRALAAPSNSAPRCAAARADDWASTSSTMTSPISSSPPASASSSHPRSWRRSSPPSTWIRPSTCSSIGCCSSTRTSRMREHRAPSWKGTSASTR